MLSSLGKVSSGPIPLSHTLRYSRFHGKVTAQPEETKDQGVRLCPYHSYAGAFKGIRERFSHSAVDEDEEDRGRRIQDREL